VRNTFKIALDSSVEVEELYLGAMNIICLNCEGRHFQCEKGGTANVFTQCCEKGKFSLPAYKESEVVRDLLHGRHQESAYFKKNIRSYNSAIAMVNTGIQSEEQNGGGPYYLRIHGAIYHQTGLLIPEDGEDAVYAQLYIYDTDEGYALRMKNPSNVECTETLMAELT